jgi:hypothetical protein
MLFKVRLQLGEVKLVEQKRLNNGAKRMAGQSKVPECGPPCKKMGVLGHSLKLANPQMIWG